MEKKERKCMKCGRVAKNGESLNSNWDGSYIVCDDCMWGIEKDGTRLADEFYSLAPRYRTKVKLQEMIDKWLDKAREEGIEEGERSKSIEISGYFSQTEGEHLLERGKGYVIISREEYDNLSKLKDNK